MVDATASGFGASSVGVHGLRRFLGAASPWLVVIALLAAWEVASGFGLVDARKLSRPSVIAALIWEWVSTGRITPHIAITFYEVIVGYILGTVLGMGVAFLFFFKPRVSALMEPLISVLNAAPRSILAPFFVLVFGMG